MPTNTIGQSIEAVIAATLRQKEIQVEHRINLLRGLIGVLFIPAIAIQTYFVARLTTSLPYLGALVVVFAGYTLAIHWLTTGDVYRRYLKYVSITVDYVLVLSMYNFYRSEGIAFFEPQGEAASIIMVFFMLIGLSALRYSHWAIVYAGALAVVASLWLSLVVGHSPMLAVHSTFVLVFTLGLVAFNSIDFRKTFVRMHQRETLTRFLPKEIVESIDRGETSISLGGEEKQVTLLLSDIRGFTSLSENLPPVRLVDLLNEYLGRMTDVLFEYGGTLDKFMGDAILAVFGSPHAHGDDPVRAVRTAMKMQEALAVLNDDLERQGIPRLRIGIALHTGQVVAGNIGSPQRMDFTVIGDSVNLVSRIEGLNKRYGTDILMSEDTYRIVQDIVPAEMIAQTPVRGRRQDVKVYTVRRPT